MPSVSIILPAYNAEKFLRQACDSILSQSYRDFELILIDDGSKDRTAGIARSYADQDERVVVISRANKGLVATLNEGIALAKAPLIARMDADDVAMPDRLALQVAFMSAHPEVVLLGGSYWLIDERGRRLTIITPPGDDATLQEVALQGKTPICHPLAMLRKSALEQAGGYREEAMLAEDLDLWLRLGEVGTLACLPDVLLEYRQHAGSLSESRQTEQQAKIAMVVDQAYQRRKLARARPSIDPWRATGDRHSHFSQTLKCGWWAFNSGYRGTARSYGIAAIRENPTSAQGWRLLACSVVKRSRSAAA